MDIQIHNQPILKELNGIAYTSYPGEVMIQDIINLMQVELSEPYPIFTYRYFLQEGKECCIMAYDLNNENKFLGCILGNSTKSKKGKERGYIAMIAVDKEYRGKKIGKTLTELFISQSIKYYNIDEIYLETEINNYSALGLYESLGFVRTKVNLNYYMNGNSAYKLKLWIKEDETQKEN